MEKNFKLNFLVLILIIIIFCGILLIANTSFEVIVAFFSGLKGEEIPIFASEQKIENIWCKATLSKLFRLEMTFDTRLTDFENAVFEANSLRFAAAEISKNIVITDMYYIDYSLFDSEQLSGTIIPFGMTVFSKSNDDSINNNRIKLCSLWYSVNN